ncbi:hypothetical protein [Winogradskyella pulchriflava]|uniref:DUF4331 domain-containing protein n=1 Tax=Winogradskyella pulchriflava TaxID=1110688 RepID=A0ABV6QA70_9FLAO
MKKIIFVFFITALCFACSSDDDNSSEFDGSLESIEDFFNPELVQALQDLGFVLNIGNNPPDIEGTYLLSPFELQASNIPSDIIGTVISDYTATFTNQNSGDLRVDFLGEGGSQTDVGTGSFVAGDGAQFTVLLKLTSQIGSVPVETAYAISGTMTENGIDDMQIGGLMLDDNGDPEGVYIENNQGRVFFDSDAFSPRQ